MMSCQNCQPLILDRIYGLLDEPETIALEQHLRECPSCALARDEAARVQGLLARAARGAYPQVKFEPPAAQPVPKTSGSTLAISTAAGAGPAPLAPVLASSTARASNAPRLSFWLSWAIAASVLLAIPGTVLPVMGILKRAELAHKATELSVATADVKAAEKEQAEDSLRKTREDAVNKFASAKQLQESLLAQWIAEEKASIQSLAVRKLTVDVLKPATVQPGAPNEFLLVLRDRGLASNAQLLAEVRDQTDAVIYSRRLNPEQHDIRHLIRLPASVWTKLSPQSELFLVVSSVDDKTQTKTELQEKIRLFGPVYTTMLVTDRATYRPGELVYFRSLTLDRITFQPPTREQFLQYELRGGPLNHTVHRVMGGTDLVRIQEGRVEPVNGPDGAVLRGIGCGAFPLPSDLQDGDYSLTVRELPHPVGYPPVMPTPVSRSIRVRSGVVDHYTKRVGFSAASYSPGDVVEAWAELKFQGEPVSGIPARIEAMADHLQLNNIVAQPTGPDGRTKFRFPLPQTLTRADVRLKVTFAIKSGGKTIEETVAERIPVVGRHLFVEFFPEGGTLVAGVPCRVYFRATTPSGQPVDIRGTITDGRNVLDRVETVTDANQPGANRGIGSFTFTPSLGTPVWLKLETPSGAFAPVLDLPPPVAPAVAAGVPAAVATRTGFMLPKPIADGVAMRVVDPVTIPGEPIRVQLQSKGRPRNLIVGAYIRGRLSDTQRISTEPGQLAEVKLMVNSDPRGGVVRITVFEEPLEQADGIAEAKPETKPDIKPIAERLVYRKPGERLQLAFAAADPRTGSTTTVFSANSSAELTLSATDEKGKPTAAILWAAAFNSGVAPGKTDRLMTTHFLLAGEVSTPDALEYADFLLTDHPEAAKTLDLVLATQGWRQFVEQSPPPLELFRGGIASERARLQASNGQFFAQSDRRKLFEMYWPRYESATRDLAKAKVARDEALANPNHEKHLHELARAAEDAQNEAQAAKERARSAAEPVERFRGAGWYGIAGFGLLAVMLGSLALTRPFGRLPYGIGSAGSISLVAFLVVAIGMADQTQASMNMKVETDTAGFQDQTPLNAAVDQNAALKRGGIGGLPPGGLKNNTMGRNFRVTPNENTVAAAAGAVDSTIPKKSSPVTPQSLGAPANAPPPSSPTVSPSFAQVKPGSGSDAKFPPPPGGLPGGFGGFPPTSAKADGSKAGENQLQLAEEDGKNGWHVPEFKRNASEAETWRFVEQASNTPFGLRRSASPLERNATSEFLLRKDAQKAKEYADDRLKLANAPLEELKPANGLPHDKQEKLPAPQANALKADILAYNRVKASITSISPLIVREYAAPRPGTTEAESELSDTILWQPVIVLPGDGKAKFMLQLGSAEGGYQIVVAGHTLDGRIGATRGLVKISP